jgi:hypothetical protein
MIFPLPLVVTFIIYVYVPLFGALYRDLFKGSIHDVDRIGGEAPFLQIW